MQRKKTSYFSRGLYQILKFLVRVFYGKTDIIGLENIPKTNAVIVGNHTQMNGPIVGELFMPRNCSIWCAGEMMNLREMPRYAFEDFWSQKPKWTHPFYRLLAYMIAPLASVIFNNARTVGVYRDRRIISTFRNTVKKLMDGNNILIFPEKDEKHNNILYRFEENFVDVARLYYKKTGIELTFVPLYIAPTLKKAYVGRSITFDSQNAIEDERVRISAYLSDEITRTARELPRHTVVPYRNIPKRCYLTNHDVTEVPR